MPLFDQHNPVTLRLLGLRDYQHTWQCMQEHLTQEKPFTTHQLWLCEHPPVYTYGQLTSSTDHPTANSTIPIIATDRGGKMTYHGPGQLIIYWLVDLRQLKWGIKQLIHYIEQSSIDLLASYGIHAQNDPTARGIYIGTKKIGAIGLKLKRNRYSYHGQSLNIDMDLSPYQHITPCGNSQLQMTQLSQYTEQTDTVVSRWCQLIKQHSHTVSIIDETGYQDDTNHRYKITWPTQIQTTKNTSDQPTNRTAQKT